MSGSKQGETWLHAPGDRYLPLCNHPQGNSEAGYWMEVVWCGTLTATRAHAWSEGCHATGSDDFNIAVVRGGRVVAWLWNDEVVDDAPDFLERITAEVQATGRLS